MDIVNIYIIQLTRYQLYIYNDIHIDYRTIIQLPSGKLTQTLKMTNLQWKLVFQPLSGRVVMLIYWRVINHINMGYINYILTRLTIHQISTIYIYLISYLAGSMLIYWRVTILILIYTTIVNIYIIKLTIYKTPPDPGKAPRR